MSRSRSVSLEIVPPKASREVVSPSQNLAAVMDAVFKSNSKQNRDDGRDAETSNTVNITSFIFALA